MEHYKAAACVRHLCSRTFGQSGAFPAQPVQKED